MGKAQATRLSVLIRHLAWLSIVLILGSFAQAETVGMRQEGPYRLKADEQLRLTFPGVPGKQQVQLTWEARMDNPKHGGALFQLAVKLNGQEVGAMRDRLQTRLLNKPANFEQRSGKTLSWHRLGSGWRVVGGPDFTIARRAVGFSKDDYRFVLDVTDLCRTDGTNEVVFHRLPIKPLEAILVLRNISVTYHPVSASAAAPSAAAPRSAAPMGMLAGTEIQPLIGPEQLGIRMGPHTLQLATRYSLPGGGWAELKGAEPASGQGGVLARADFRVQRTARWDEGRLLVEETVTNLRKNKPVGLRIEHRMGLGGISVNEVRLGGAPDPSLVRVQSPANPTLYAQLGAPGIGIVLEDDVMRAQHDLMSTQKADQFGWQTHHFALAAGKSHTFRYSLYPLDKGDYFTFINKVRRDWGVPRRIDGPFVLFFEPRSILAMQPEKLAAEIERLGLKGFGSRTWYEASEKGKGKLRTTGFGVGVLDPAFESYRQQLRQAGELLHKVAPGMPVFFYSHVSLHSPEARGDAARYKNEWITTAKGQRVIRKSPDFKDAGGVIPEVDGAFGRAFREAIATLIQDLHYDGIYFDESRGSGTSPWTYNRYDGVSGDLDRRTNEVLATKGSSYLLGLPYRLAFYKWLDAKGYFILANGSPVNMAENKLSFPRQVETHRAPHRAYELHLYTPLAYTAPNPSMEVIRENLMRGVLPFRAAPGASSEVLKYFFPLTVAELGHGYIIGDERVVTAVSGTFRPTTNVAKGQLLLFDSKGQSTSAPQEVDLTTGVKIEVPEDGVAVLIAE